MPVLASMVAGEAPKPKVRMQAPDTPPTKAAKLVLPTPEELGVVAAPRAPAAATPTETQAAVDWNDAHARLRRLGALRFDLERVSNGHRVTFLLPTDRSDRTHQIEVAAATEAQAVQTALEQAEAWAARK